MKLIIDIPFDVYECILSTNTIETTDYNIVSLYRAIKTGTIYADTSKISSEDFIKAFGGKTHG